MKGFTNEHVNAIGRLKKTKVWEYMITDNFVADEWESLFDYYWWMCLHEVDLFEEGEESPMTASNVKTARKWLKDTQHLTVELQDVDF